MSNTNNTGSIGHTKDTDTYGNAYKSMTFIRYQKTKARLLMDVRFLAKIAYCHVGRMVHVLSVMSLKKSFQKGQLKFFMVGLRVNNCKQEKNIVLMDFLMQ